MGNVTRTELNQQTARVLARVEKGEHIVVTDRGRPIAEIAPYAGSRWDALVAAGRVTPAATAGALSALPVQRETTTADLLRDLRAERR